MKKHDKKCKNKIMTCIAVFLLQTMLMCSIAFAAMPSSVDADSLSGQNSALPQVTGYKAYTNHQGTAVSMTDDQYVCLDVYYDSQITMESSEAVIGQLAITFGGTDLQATSTASILEDGKTLHLEMHFPFAGYAGSLAIQSTLERNTLSAVTKAGEVSCVNFPEVYMFVSNGITFSSVSDTVGTSTTSASVTKQVVVPSSATRGMVQMLFLKNGEPVGTLNTYGSNLISHFHMYLSLDAPTFATYIQSSFSSLSASGKAFEGYTLTADGSNITITANDPSDGEVLDLIILGYPNDRDTKADKTELSTAISNAQNYIKENNITDTELSDEISIANAYKTCIYYTQDQIDNETAKLIEALETSYSKNVAFTSTDSVTGITVSATSGVIAYGTSLQTEVLSEGDTYNTIKDLISTSTSKFTVYNISLVKDGSVVEPNGKVTISLAAPTGYDQDKLAVYHIVDGVKTTVEFTVSNGVITFDTDSLSPYVIADISVASDTTTTTPTTPTEETPVVEETTDEATTDDTTDKTVTEETTAGETVTEAESTTVTETDTTAPQTGDSNLVILWLLCGTLACASFATVLKLKKKEN